MITADPFDQAQRVADAVLWEGYVLYPYRASAAKNQVRWQYGVLTPKHYAQADGHERFTMQTECIIEFGPASIVDIRLRFLQVQTRTIEQADGNGFSPVAELQVDGVVWTSWDEAIEHMVDISAFPVAENGVRAVPISLTGGLDVAPLGRAGRVVRECWPITAVARLRSERCPGPYPLTRLHIEIENTTDWNDTAVVRDVAMRRSLVAVHTLLRCDEARFVSLLDPAEFARSAVATCTNTGTFPVLVGDPDRPTTMLSSPIILYDHPAVASESRGDMCDATEIDEILSLRILTLTDDEKRAARGTDRRAAAIIDRIEAFTPDVFADLHGEMRAAKWPGGEVTEEERPWWDPSVDAEANPWEDSVMVAGVGVAKGSVVRLRPGNLVGRRADAQDLFLAGLEAVVEGVFSDVDGDTHVAVTLLNDPAADLHQWHGRYYYFHPDEIEPMT
jgi:hypothetical protein